MVNSDDPSALPDSVADRINLRLNSGPAYKLLVWNIDYRKETIDYENRQDIDTEVITANARRLITPTVGLLAQAGYDYYRSGAIETTIRGAIVGRRVRLGADTAHASCSDCRSAVLRQ